MLKRLSQKVKLNPPANVAADRYSFLSLADAEPYLGQAAGNNYVLSGNVDGTRRFGQIGTYLIAGQGIGIEANGLIFATGNIDANLTGIAFVRYDYVSGDRQNIFGGTPNVDYDGKTIVLGDKDQVEVYYNGVLLQANVDYYWSNAGANSVVVLREAADENSLISIVRITPVADLFTTANIRESADPLLANTTVGNVYFTNARARAAFTGGSGIVIAANGLITITGNITANVTGSILASQVVETGNPTTGYVFFTNTRARQAFTNGSGIVIESNGMIVANVTAQAFSGNTNLVPEGSNNLYFTNARAVGALTGGTGIVIAANGRITFQPIGALYTPNIIEVGDTTTGYVYFTNARARAAFTAGNGIVLASNGLITTTLSIPFINASNVIEDGNATSGNVFFTNSRAVSAFTPGQNIFIESNGLISANVSIGAIPTLYTPNIVEVGSVSTGNVYFTQSRARNSLQAGPGITYDVTTGTITANVQGGANLVGTLFTPNVIEVGNTTSGNVYFTNARAITAITPLLNTSNVIEGSNLYFNNTRARQAFTAGQNIYIEANGMIISSATISSLPTIYASNVVEDGTTTSGNVFFTNARARAAFTGGVGITYNGGTGAISAAVHSVVGKTGNVTISTSDVSEGSNLYFTNARSIGALTGGTGVVIAANGLITANLPFSGNTNIVPEGSANLYFTNARARAALSAGNGLVYSPANGIFTANVISVNGLVGAINLVTGNISESGNTTSGNVFFTNARARAAFTAGSGIVIQSNGLIISSASGFSGFLDASAVIEDGNTTIGNVFFTNARAIAAFTGGTGINVASNGRITNTGVINIDGRSGNISLYTPNIIETGNATSGNVYFTNTRAVAAFTGGVGILISANGLITATAETTPNITANSITRALIANDAIDTAKLANDAVTIAKLAIDSVAATKIIDYNVTTTKIANGAVTAVKISGISTSNISEGSNLYFTNARSVGALTGGTGIAIDANGLLSATGIATASLADYSITNVKISNLTIVANNIQSGAVTGSKLSSVFTSNIAEGSNLYFTNTRVGSYLADTGTTIVGNLIPSVAGGRDLGNSTHPWRDVWITAASLRLGNIKLSEANGALLVSNVISGGPTLFTSNIIESGNTTTGNVYFTNARAVAAFTGGTGVTIASNGLLTVSGLSATSIADYSITGVKHANLSITTNILVDGAVTVAKLNSVFTANIPEVGNLYFTNARAVSALTGGNGIVIASNGLITANITGISAGAVTTNTIADANVTTAKLADSSVTTAKIADTNVTTAKLADSSVTTAKIADTNVTTAKIADTNVTTNKLAANAVTTAKLAVGAVDANILADGSVTGRHIFALFTGNVSESSSLYFTNARAVGALTGGSGITIASNGLITASGLGSGAGSVGTTNLADGSVTTAKIADVNVTTAKLADSSVTGIKLNANTNFIPEGSTNLYFTNARAQGALSNGTGINYSSGSISINTGVVVTISDNQTITGVKTFSGGIYSSTNAYNFGTGANQGSLYFTLGTNTYGLTKNGGGDVFTVDPNGISIDGSSSLPKATGSTSNFLRADGTWATPSSGSTIDSSTNLQLNSLGVGTAGSGTAGEIRATNNITAYYSDDRLKTRIGNIENALDKVRQLTGFYYQANELAQSLGYEAKREVGLSAQDMQKVLPEIVTKAPIDDRFLTMYYEKITPLLVEAIKELADQVDEIKRNIK
ncbi:MAG: hypothetical protein EBU90_11010 [Proteobacteria bacterium]|nr:hypothetical protein [Pseudomonadota bacterium]